MAFNSVYAIICNLYVHTVWFPSGSCLQMEFRGDHVHAARRLSALLAQETDDDAAHDLGRTVRLLVSGVGGPLRHGQRFGKINSVTQLMSSKCDAEAKPESNSPRGVLRSLGCWWWTRGRGSQPPMFSTTPSSHSMWWMRCDSSLHTEGSRWEIQRLHITYAQCTKANRDFTLIFLLVCKPISLWEMVLLKQSRLNTSIPHNDWRLWLNFGRK